MSAPDDAALDLTGDDGLWPDEDEAVFPADCDVCGHPGCRGCGSDEPWEPMDPRD